MNERASPSSTPIDAEFEPADTPNRIETRYEKPRKKTRSGGGGPGWFSLFLVGLIAIGSLGFSLWSSGVLEQSTLPTPAETGLAGLRDNQAALNTRVGELAARVEGMVDRIDSEIERVDSGLAAIENQEPVMLTEGAIPVDLEARLAGLEDQIASLEEAQSSAVAPSRIEAIETALQSAGAASGPSNAQLVALRSKLETLRADLSGLQASQQDFASQLDVVRTDTAEMSKSSAQAVSASLALAAIEATASRGESFEAEYSQLRDARPDDPDVRALASLSKIGIPTLAQLKTDFRTQRTSALARDTESASGMGWVNTVFGESVSVRRTDPASETADRLADAEAALARDDLLIAIEAVDSLPEASKPVFQTWLADARRRARLEDSLEDLRLKLIAAGQ